MFWLRSAVQLFDDRRNIEEAFDDAESFAADLFVGLHKVGHHDRTHACGESCADAVGRILEDHAVFRGDAQLFGSGQEDIGGGLAVFDHVAADHLVEIRQDTGLGQFFAGGLLNGGGGNRGEDAGFVQPFQQVEEALFDRDAMLGEIFAEIFLLRAFSL